MMDWLSRLLGPGHLGKAEVVKQDVFHWPFATLTRVGRGRWTLDVYFNPNFPRSNTAKWPTIHLSLMTQTEVLKRAADENRLAAERWAKKKKQQRIAIHDSLSKDSRSGHRGNISQCPVCQAAKKGGKPKRIK
jgi:hypothetical protein